MPKIFTDEEREVLRVKLMERGFELLKTQGFKGIRIEALAMDCYIAKGTFYAFFESKSEFLYQIMLYERQRAKDALLIYTDEDGKLSAKGLYQYLRWLFDENPNVFAYLTPAEQQYFLTEWPSGYIEHEDSDHATMNMLCNMLREPRADARPECACNLMKMGAAALTVPSLFLRNAWDETLDLLTRQIVACLTEQEMD